MTTLLEFIEQRLQDDQDRALAAAETLRCGCHGTTDAERASWSYAPLDDGVWHTSNLHPVFRARQWETGHLENEIGEHVAAHDPARVLREVQAKRRLLTLIFAYEAFDDAERGCSHTADQIAAGACPAAQRIPALLVLASVWQDHPDYDPSWSPT